MRPILLTLLTTAALGLAACGSDGSSTTASSPGGAAASSPADAAPATGPSPAGSVPKAADGGTCADVQKPAAKSADVSKPTGSLDKGKTYVVSLKTSCGTIDITLDQKNNPKTANAFAHLAKSKYFDGTIFHRVVPGFVIQGGDPTGTGTGGPSWQVVEAPKSNAKYTSGVVAMAKTGNDPAGASGSQFFIVVGADVGLPAEYAIAGKVSKGQDVAELIAAQGDPGTDGPPKKTVELVKATLTEK